MVWRGNRARARIKKKKKKKRARRVNAWPQWDPVYGLEQADLTGLVQQHVGRRGGSAPKLPG